MKDSGQPLSLFFFGSMMLPEESQKNPCSSFSANRFQYELLINLLKIRSATVTAICPVPLHSFPLISRLLVPGRKIRPQLGLQIISPSFVNWGPMKVLSLIFTVMFAAARAITAEGRPDVLMVYNPYLGYTIPALFLSKLLKIPSVGIVADLRPAARIKPQGALRQIDANIQQWLAKRFDGMLPFSIHTVRDLGFAKPYFRLDPGISPDEFESSEPVASGQCERALLFSGTLSEDNGLRLLLDAFARICDGNLELWISGRGEMKALVEALARKNPRVRYLGFLERNELLRIMQRSLLLVNPRPSSLPENRYNFPSKILEYLASGRPVISLASGDIAREYGDHLFILTEESSEALARLIDDVCQKSPEELDSKGRSGRHYVLEKKSWAVISEKVRGFLYQAVEDGRP